MAEGASAQDKRASSYRKKGGGIGRKGGFGYMFDANFMALFAEALDSVIQMIQFPPNGVFDEEHVAGEQGALHRATLEAFRPIHELIQARKHKKREIKWLAVTDAVRRYVYGNSMRDVIPSYIVLSIQNLSEDLVSRSSMEKRFYSAYHCQA